MLTKEMGCPTCKVAQVVLKASLENLPSAARQLPSATERKGTHKRKGNMRHTPRMHASSACTCEGSPLFVFIRVRL